MFESATQANMGYWKNAKQPYQVLQILTKTVTMYYISYYMYVLSIIMKHYIIAIYMRKHIMSNVNVFVLF